MSKRKLKITALLTAVVILAVSLIAVAATASIDDGMFKNNTPSYITLNQSATGSINAEDDYEAYIFEIEEDGVFSLRLDHEETIDMSRVGWRVTLYKIIEGETREYREIAYYGSFWDEVTSAWGETGLTKGAYCIVVRAGTYFVQSDFTLVTMFTATDIYEKEPNDTVEEATLMQVKYGKYGASSNRENDADMDWYAFELDEDSCVNLTFTHADKAFPTIGWSVTLLTEELETITQFTASLNEPLVKTGVIGLKSGKYYVKVESQTNMVDTYTLLVGADKAVNNEFELNDVPEAATELPQNVTITGSLADRMLGLDKDYFRFVVPADGYIDFEFSHELIEGDKKGWNIRIIKPMEDGSYFEVVRKISKWNEQRYIIENLGLEAGEYYACIDGDSVNYNCATYACKWNFTEKANFEKEPNSIIRRAEDISFGQYYYGAIISTDVLYDEDFYKFELTDTTRVCLEFYHTKTNAIENCWIASIVDEDGFEMASVKSHLNERLVTTGVVELPAGVYYVKIETGMYGSEMPYYFRLVR